jgi:hypothetical protein
MPRKAIDVPALFRLWNDHTIRPEDVAIKLGISTTYLRRAAAYYGLAARPVWRDTSDNDAPSDAEELRSQDSLALSPWVAARAEMFRREKEQRGEPARLEIGVTALVTSGPRRRRVAAV